MEKSLDRSTGALVGLAAGDALGTTLEFAFRDEKPHLTDIIGGGPFRLKAGYWTDDTSMALCLAESIDERQGYDPDNQAELYIRWWKKGYLSSNGECFDIGSQTARALLFYESKARPDWRTTYKNGSGNGSLMRLSPVPVAYQDNIEQAVLLSGDSSRVTHPTQESVQACRVYGHMIVNALGGMDKQAVIQELPAINHGELPANIRTILTEKTYSTKTRDEISSSGFVVHSLEAALWAFWNTDTFRDGALLAANLADDADTVAAIYGQLAGAYYGELGIPDEWLAKIHDIGMIREKAHRLYRGIGTFGMHSIIGE